MNLLIALADSIVSDPGVISTLTEDDCEFFLSAFKYKRNHKISTARNLLKTELNIIRQTKRTQQQQTKHTEITKKRALRVEQSANSIINKLMGLYNRSVFVCLDDPEEAYYLLKNHGRCHANIVHDFPSIWTGLESTESIERRLANPKYKPCKDHFHPRQWVGEQLVLAILRHEILTLYELAVYIHKYCHVHYITPEQNKKLMPSQNSESFVDWNTCYKDNNISLIQHKPHQIHKGWEYALEKLHNMSVCEDLKNSKYFRRRNSANLHIQMQK